MKTIFLFAESAEHQRSMCTNTRTAVEESAYVPAAVSVTKKKIKNISSRKLRKNLMTGCSDCEQGELQANDTENIPLQTITAATRKLQPSASGMLNIGMKLRRAIPEHCFTALSARARAFLPLVLQMP